MKPGVADRDERRQGIAHHGQADRAEPMTWHGRQLKGQGKHTFPGLVAHRSADRAEHENRHGEGFVFAITTDHRAGDGRGVE